MKYLIVGLGNIGPKYKNTRHNIGFEVVDYLAEQLNTSFDSDRHAFVASGKHKGRNITLIKPTTYMNLSGKAVNYWMKSLKVPVSNVLIVVDDLALPLGAIRMRGKGSSAGHNGLKDIEAVLGNSNYPRLRFGIGDDYAKGKQADFVLGEFTDDERIDLPDLIKHSAEMCLAFTSLGMERTMNMYNKK